MELDFGESNEEAMVVVKSLLQRLHADFYGNGRVGVMEEFRQFINFANGEKAERERNHKQNTARLNIIIGLLSALAAFFTTYVTLFHK